MTDIHRKLQQFLLTDLGISLTNIRSHLTWAAASPCRDGSIPFSVEDAMRITAVLERVEQKATALAEGLHAEQQDPAGLQRALYIVASGMRQ